MIPRTIHYCWFGHNPMPPLAEQCIASWHQHMPEWNYWLWNEDNFDVNSTPYTAEAYATGKYAFVSDYVRLWALQHEGGLYLDTDVKVFRPMDDLLTFHAFAGFEGSKYTPMATCIMASEPGGKWVSQMLAAYDKLHFLRPDGTPDLVTNVQRLTALMAANGFRQDNTEQDYLDLHVFPVDYFCPRQTTGEYLRTDRTYCEHLALSSWADQPHGLKQLLLSLVGQQTRIRLIKLKRKLLG